MQFFFNLVSSKTFRETSYQFNWLTSYPKSSRYPWSSLYMHQTKATFLNIIGLENMLTSGLKHKYFWPYIGQIYILPRNLLILGGNPKRFQKSLTEKQKTNSAQSYPWLHVLTAMSIEQS